MFCDFGMFVGLRDKFVWCNDGFGWCFVCCEKYWLWVLVFGYMLMVFLVWIFILSCWWLVNKGVGDYWGFCWVVSGLVGEWIDLGGSLGCWG